MGGGGSPSQRNDTVPGLSWGNNNVPCVSSVKRFRKDLVCVYQAVYKWTYYYNTGVNGNKLTNSHFPPHFDHCDLINAMVQLTVALASQRYVKTLFRHCLDLSRHIKHV